MDSRQNNKLSKAERLCSKKLINTLFGSGNHSFPIYPLRVVYAWVDAEKASAQCSFMVSVSKKRFKHAVDRNRVKRQVRESYREHKHLLQELSLPTNRKLIMVFIWLDTRHRESKTVNGIVKKLLLHIVEHPCCEGC
ncbi:MAG: ribonuclease P protein component [Bacteroidales bacterium]|nr:ribonuclease P protein component [Bacteroidales bacterium]